MGSAFKDINPDVTEDYITVKTASKFSGYNEQYLRRILREGIFKTRKIGQIWLIDHSEFVNYLSEATQATDKRFGPQTVQYYSGIIVDG